MSSELPREPDDELVTSREVSPWVLDVLFAVAVACLIGLVIAVAEGGERPPDIWAFVFAAGFGALLLARRRFPRLMLIMTVLGVFGYYTIGYSPIGVAVPVVAALFCAADSGFLAWSILAGLVDFGVSMAFRLLKGDTVNTLIGYETISNLALITMAIALGNSRRLHRLRAVEHSLIIRLNADRADAQAQLQLQSERQRISRDLHDTVGHTMSVISLHAGVAAEAIGADDAAAAAAIERVRDASRRTLTELRQALQLLRSGPATADEMTLARVAELIEPLQQAGIAVRSTVDLGPERLPRPIDIAAYRVVQESLTNIVRHAAAHRAIIDIHVVGPALRISIIDAGRGPVDHADSDGEGPPGQGLIGMRERVRSVGGIITTGRASHGGFAVTAEIPLEGDS